MCAMDQACYSERDNSNNSNDRLNSFCIPVPRRSEERCNCCDGKGWVGWNNKEPPHSADPYLRWSLVTIYW